MISLLYVPFCLSLVGGLVSDFGKRFRFFGFLFSFLFLFIFLGFRAESVGTDTATYYRIFHDIYSGFDVRYEFAYVALNKVMALIVVDPFWTIASVSFLILVMQLFFLYNYSPSFLFSLILFFLLSYYFLSFNALRHSLAIGVCCLSFYYIVSRKFIYFLICMVLASGFHLTSLVFIGAYFLGKRIPKVWLALWLGSLFFALFLDPISFMRSAFPAFIFGDYGVYVFRDVGGAVAPIKLLFNQLVAVMFLLYLFRVKGSGCKQNFLLVNISLAGIVAGNFLYGAGWIERITDFYQFFLVVAIPVVVFKFFHGLSRVLIILSFVFLCLIFYQRMILIGSHGVSPYELYWPVSVVGS